MPWEAEIANLLRDDLHAHRKLTRELLEATRDMRDALADSHKSAEALATSLDAFNAEIRLHTTVMSAVLGELQLLRETISAIVSPAPVHAHTNGGG